MVSAKYIESCVDLLFLRVGSLRAGTKSPGPGLMDALSHCSQMHVCTPKGSGPGLQGPGDRKE